MSSSIRGKLSCPNLIMLYYQRSAECLSTCPMTVHALIYLADNIKKSGPLCMNWSFMMECWCGRLLPAIKLHVYPYKSLTHQQQQLLITQENSILVQYNLFDVVCGPTIDPDDPCHREEVLNEGMYIMFPSMHHVTI